MASTSESSTLSAIEQDLVALALTLPEAAEDFPWGERVIKVRGKIFLFAGMVKGDLRISMKLPQSHLFALDLPNAAPTGYNLGKSGWVTLKYQPDDPVDGEQLRHWLLESYRAVAPKRLGALVPAVPARPDEDP